MNAHYTTLRDDKISLEPLTPSHIEKLMLQCGDPDIWKWFSADLTDPKDLKSWMEERLRESEAGQKMSYAVIYNQTEDTVGSTSYGNIEWKEKVIEIGWTWIGSQFIGSGINKHMKYLMLNHAFEVMEIERLEIRTDEINVRSRRAIEKIGAKLEGTLRYHRYTRGGRRRNTVVYGIIKPDWPEIRSTIFKEF